MARTINVRAGRGRRDYAQSFADALGLIDSDTETLNPGSAFGTWTPGTVQPVGSTDPGARNVGHRIPIGSMTVIAGDFTPAANTTYSGLYIQGRVIPTSASTNAILRDCFIEGKFWAQGPAWVSGTPTQDAAFNNAYNGRNVTLEWCTIDMTGRESVFADGVRGNNFTMRYCEIKRTVDGWGAVAGAYYGPTLLENCRIHNGYYIAYMDPTNGLPNNYQPYPGFLNQNDRRTHNDGVQIQAFANNTIRGCFIGGARAPLGSNGAGVKQANRDYLNPAHQPVIAAVDAADDYSNTAIIVQNSVPSGGPVGALIELNWLAGGDATVNLFASTTDTLGGVIVRNNRFVRQSQFPASDGFNGYAIHKASVCTSTISANVWDDTGLAVPITTY